MRIRFAAAVLAVTLSGAFPAALVALDAFPLDDVRPGMTGVGRTVFEGSRIDSFSVRILGVLRNVLGPGHCVVLARLGGGPLEQTGVMSGMSGSPVFLDGRLLGAVAFSFPFGKEPIAGITPIGEMVDATSTTTTRLTSARVRSVPAVWPLAADALLAPLRQRLPSFGATAYSGEALPRGVAGLTLRSVALPLTLSGFDSAAFDAARDVLTPLGFTAVIGGGTLDGGTSLPALEPGSPVAVSLIEGDLDVSATGTVTHIEDDRVYAFGHPFFNLGPTRFPMRKAYVHSLLASIQQSAKIAAPGESVGTFEQDRSTAVAGRLGPPPRMIPIDVTLRNSRGPERAFHLRVVDDELLTPTLAYASLLSLLQSSERVSGTSTVRISGQIALSGGRELRIDDVFAVGQPAQQAAVRVAIPLALVMGNGFEKVDVLSLSLDVSSSETIETASIDRVWVDQPGPIRPGASLSLNVAFRGFRDQMVTKTLRLRVPLSATPGPYTLTVSDGASLTALDQRDAIQPLASRNLDQLVRALNGLRHTHHVYARLSRAGQGVIVDGTALPSLPTSILSVLATPEQGTSVQALRTAVVADVDEPTDFAVSGMRFLALTIAR